MSERAALYARVSTARQEQEKTVASQVEALSRAAEALGVAIASEHKYVDEGFSGSRLDRPGLDRLRDAAADGLIDVALVYCPDRLARSYIHQQVVLEELQKRGVRVHFVEHPIGERAEDRLLVQMQGVIAEYERAKILERTRRGRLHKVRSGQMLPFSTPPYGYAILRSPEVPHGLAVVDEVEAEHVRAMYRWVLDENLSARQVAKRLNTVGVRPRRATLWVAGSVYCVLTNPAYAGMAIYGKREPVEPKHPRRPGAYRKNAKSSHHVRPEAQWLRVPIPPIVDERMQVEVRARLAKNKVWAPRRVQHDYLLRTLVTCGECGWKMYAAHQKSACKRYQYFYYGCQHRDSVDTGREHKCKARRVRADELDALVWDALRSWIQSPRMLREEIAAWRASRQGAAEMTRERTRLDSAQRRLDLQIERLVDAYQHGAIDVEELKARRERLDAAREANRLRAQELDAQGLDRARLDRARLDRLGEDLAAFAATLREGLDELDFAGRQRLVRLLIERVVIAGDHVAIEHAIPLTGRFSGLRQGDRDAVQGAEDPLPDRGHAEQQAGRGGRRDPPAPRGAAPAATRRQGAPARGRRSQRRTPRASRLRRAAHSPPSPHCRRGMKRSPDHAVGPRKAITHGPTTCLARFVTSRTRSGRARRRLRTRSSGRPRCVSRRSRTPGAMTR
jgi:site-specific DNA recombinase